MPFPDDDPADPAAGDDRADRIDPDAIGDADADGADDDDARDLDDADDSFAVRVGIVADYLEDNAAAVFEEAVGRPLDPDDPLLEKLVLGVFARYFVEKLQTELRQGKSRRADLDKLAAARSIIDDAVVSALRHFSGGQLREIAWRGPGDEQLLAFAYAVAASWQVGATADALLDIELGLDPDTKDRLSAQLDALTHLGDPADESPDAPDRPV